MARLGDWEQRLTAYLARHAQVSLVWGETDCCMFAAGAVIAQTGVDPMPEFRGRYLTEIGSRRALIRYGTGDLETTVATKFEDRPIGFARRGDLVMHAGAVGVCIGAEALFVPLEGTGLARVPRALWARAFAV